MLRMSRFIPLPPLHAFRTYYRMKFAYTIYYSFNKMYTETFSKENVNATSNIHMALSKD